MTHDLTYTHRQSGLLLVFFTCIAVVGAAFAAYVAVRKVGPGIPLLVPLVFAIIMMAIGIAFTSLTITVGAGDLTWWFGPGVARKSVALHDVVGAVPVRNSWMYGWGIRFTPHGWLYNVSGLDAVEVTLNSGKRFRLGTDEPDTLARAIMASPR